MYKAKIKEQDLYYLTLNYDSRNQRQLPFK